MSSHSQHRLQALDGLRAVSIAMVFFSHAGFGHVVPGGLGVTIFFFISGFIITKLMLSEWDAKGGINVRHFYVRRLFRLTPALLLFVGISVTLMSLVGDVWTWTEPAAVFLYFANYYGIYSTFSGELIKQPLAITWSLAVEEHFYFVFPFLFMIFAGAPRRFLGVIVTILLVMLTWRSYLVYGIGLDHLPHYRIYTATDTRADSILYGVCLSLVMVRYPQLFARLNTWRGFAAGAVIMLISLAIRDENFRESLRYSLQGMALFLMFATLMFSRNYFNSFLQWPPVVYVGRISYSLYLYHWLVIGVVAWYMPGASALIRLLAVTVFSWLLSHLSYRYIEQRFQAMGRKLLS
ncbi:acyltransferase family protein [Undibacterium sp. Ji49W]|uniref:acyltransferase family protein n=1 Tax=Undibacterium sp. Ji49W TaxID=3413040 RepID=UPI003BF3C4FE